MIQNRGDSMYSFSDLSFEIYTFLIGTIYNTLYVIQNN